MRRAFTTESTEYTHSHTRSHFGFEDVGAPKKPEQDIPKAFSEELSRIDENWPKDEYAGLSPFFADVYCERALLLHSTKRHELAWGSLEQAKLSDDTYRARALFLFHHSPFHCCKG